MLCQQCFTENPKENRFCMSCGESLTEPNAVVTPKEEHHKRLSVETIRFIISVFGLLILNWIVTSMSFLKDLQIPESDLSTEVIVKSVIYLLIIILLLRFASLIGYFWKKAFPNFSQAALFIQTILFLISLSVFYDSTLWLFNQYIEDPQILLIYQLTLGGIAIILLIRAGSYFYQVLPLWLKRINLTIDMPEEQEEDKF